LLLDCSSLDGNRAIGDVFDILDNAVAVGSSNAFVLCKIDDLGQFLPTIYQHSDPGTFNPGRYVIGKLDSICYSALVFIVSQFLRKMEWRFCEKSRRCLGLA